MNSVLGKTLMGGAVAAFSIKAAVDPTSSNLPLTGKRKVNLTYEEMATQGFWKKQGNIAGLAIASGDIGGYVGYGFSNLASPLTSGKGPIYGMVAGGAVGAASTLAFRAISKIKGRAIPSYAVATGSGAVLGGIAARKIQLQLSESFNTVRKNMHKKPMFSNKTRTQGPGYRLWAQRTSMGKPGHLGVTGSLPFAMHSARHRSTV